jgi:hypothetical protein
MQANPNSILFLFSLVLIEEWDYFCYISLKNKNKNVQILLRVQEH